MVYGGSTLSITSLLGIPNLIDLMRAGYLGTDAIAAPFIGIIGSIFQYVLCGAILIVHRKKIYFKGYGI